MIEEEFQEFSLIRWTDEAVITAAKEAISEIAAAAISAKKEYSKVGNIVTYGHYEQHNDFSNGKEAIEWIVIKHDNKNGKSLLLSRYGLDAYHFNHTIYHTWA